MEASGGNPILCLPTGAGKSIIIAEICKKYPTLKILIVTHVKELIEQNHSKINGAGIYSAGVGRRDLNYKIIFCGIQSVYKKAEAFGDVDLVIIDECHLLSPNQETMYGRFINDLSARNEKLRVIGLSATPYRTNDGLLTDCTLFDDLAYDVPLSLLVSQGYLSPLKSKGGLVSADLSGVRTTAGDYNKKDMASAFDQDTITRRATDEIKALGHARKSWLIFCSSVEHCFHIQEYIPHSGVITGETPREDRERIINDFKQGRIKCLINYGVLTTGFDAPQIDLIVLLRATKSTGLYVQMLGRGMRIAPGKTDCLVLDYGNNIETHGPVDAIRILPKRQRDGTITQEISLQPTKLCPSCRTDNHARASVCPECGYEYPAEFNHEEKASDAAIMSTDIKPEWVGVDVVTFTEHKKQGKPDSLKVTYMCGIQRFSQWICLEHDGFARTKARAWWLERAQGPPPETINEALDRRGEIKWPKEILIRKAGKYDEIIGYRGETKNTGSSDTGADDHIADTGHEIVW